MWKNVKHRLHSLAFTAALLVVAGCTVTLPPTVIRTDDGAIVLSPYNWRSPGARYLHSNNPGAYLQLGFSGTSIAASFDTSAFDALGRPASERPQIWVSIDGQAPDYYQPEGGVLVLASGLAAGNHTLELGFAAAQFSNDRWLVPANVVKITDFRIDAGASTFAPAVSARRVLLYWDSIGEGFRVLETVAGPPGTVENSDTRRAFGLRVAADLDMEIGIVAFSAQGWTRPGGGNVPNFPNAWDARDGTAARSFDPAPDVVVVGHGTNDGLAGVPSSTIRGAVRSWLEEARAALPTTDLVVVIPFGGYARAAISDAFADYQADFPGDAQVHLVDLGGDAEDIVAANAPDSVHPDVVGQRLLAELLAAALAPIVGP